MVFPAGTLAGIRVASGARTASHGLNGEGLHMFVGLAK